MPYFSGTRNVATKVPLMLLVQCDLLIYGATMACHADSKDTLQTMSNSATGTFAAKSLSPRVQASLIPNQPFSPSTSKEKIDTSPKSYSKNDKTAQSTAIQTILLPGPAVGKSLLMIPKEANPTALEDYATATAPIGARFVRVSKGTGLCLKAAYAVVDKPQLLLECPKNDMLEVDFEGMEVDDQALKYICDFKNLRKIDLHRTDVTDAGLAYIENLKNWKMWICAPEISTERGFDHWRHFRV